MSDIEHIIKIAHKIGEQKEIVQGSGGNISLKLSDRSMLVKASGCTFSEISKDYGLSLVDCKKISDYYRNLENNLINDNNVYADKILLQSKLSGHRPSMETSFHSYLDKVVIHTHPVHVNILACSIHGENYVREALNSTDFLWVPYTTPGHALGKKIYSQMKNTNGKIPKVIVLQNHGIIISEDDLYKSVMLHDEIIEKIEQHLAVKNIFLPEWPKTEWENIGGGFWMGKNPLLEKSIQNYECAKKFTSNHCFPDSAVFLNDVQIFGDLAQAKQTKSKVNILFGKGFFYQTALGKAKEYDEILTANKIIIENANFFGGPRFLNEQEVKKIVNLDAEKYRQSMK